MVPEHRIDDGLIGREHHLENKVISLHLYIYIHNSLAINSGLNNTKLTLNIYTISPFG